MTNSTWEVRLGQLITESWKKGIWHSESTLFDSLKDFIRAERAVVLEKVDEIIEKEEQEQNRMYNSVQGSKKDAYYQSSFILRATRAKIKSALKAKAGEDNK
jgi:hypothetical protein